MESMTYSKAYRSHRPDEMAGPTPVGDGPLVSDYPFNYDGNHRSRSTDVGLCGAIRNRCFPSGYSDGHRSSPAALPLPQMGSGRKSTTALPTIPIFQRRLP